MDGVGEYEEAVNEAVKEIAVCLSEELQEILNKGRACWVKDWVSRRETLGASATILRELSEEDPLEFKKHLRMSVDQFNELLTLVEPEIKKTDTVMRNAIPVRAKLEVALRYLATGDSYQSLALLFRIPACTISRFMPEVLEAITRALRDYMKVIGQTLVCARGMITRKQGHSFCRQLTPTWRGLGAAKEHFLGPFEDWALLWNSLAQLMHDHDFRNIFKHSLIFAPK